MSDKGYGYILQEAAPIEWGDMAAIGILILFFIFSNFKPCLIR